VDDETLMAATARGDAQAFAGLVDRHADRVMAFAYTVLESRSEAEDVSQDVFVTLWQKAGEWQPSRSKLTT
jgi:RNA polymerase sigma-70 factor, ECF subfamily